MAGLHSYRVLVVVAAIYTLVGCGSKSAREAEAERLISQGNESFGLGEFDKALADFTEAIRVDPGNAIAYHNRGVIWSKKGDEDKALADFDKAIQLDPGYGIAFKSRGVSWGRKGDYEKAIADYTEAIRLNPQYPVSFSQRGNAWFAKGHYDEALADYGEAIRVGVNTPDPYFDRAWALATCPNAKYRDGAKAVEDAKHGCELDGRASGRLLAIRAAAHAEAGQFEEAIRFQKEALKDPAYAKGDPAAQKALELYETKKPFRSE